MCSHRVLSSPLFLTDPYFEGPLLLRMRIKENPVDFFMGQEHVRSMSKEVIECGKEFKKTILMDFFSNRHLGNRSLPERTCQRLSLRG